MQDAGVQDQGTPDRTPGIKQAGFKTGFAREVELSALALERNI